ncbi:uromodulin-like [Engraulis encrasicolus]|uniref:uromodulin-like n=1 Tax=Engraulis encrasicolus TaxID=184585 RepID=UPI002FD720D7
MMMIMKSQLPLFLPLVAIILSAYQATGVSAQESDPCYNYTILNDTWRSTEVVGNIFSLRCDGGGHWQGWYLLVHQNYSVRMPTSCVQPFRCGTAGTIWMNGSHPSPEEGVVTRQACPSYNGFCCHPSYPLPNIQVKTCPGNYTVYKLEDPVHYCGAYCADFSSRGALPPQKTMGMSLTLSSAERLNETEVEEQVLPQFREFLQQQGIELSRIRLRSFEEVLP